MSSANELTLPITFKSGEGWQFIKWAFLTHIPLIGLVSYILYSVVKTDLYWVPLIVAALDIPASMIVFNLMKVGSITIDKFIVTTKPDTYFGIQSALPAAEINTAEFEKIRFETIIYRGTRYAISLIHKDQKTNFKLCMGYKGDEMLRKAETLATLLQKPLEKQP